MKIIILIFTCALCLCVGQTILDEELYHNVLNEELCTRQLENMDKLMFYDSSFRVPQGLFEGNLESYGNFHQCLGINQEFVGGNIEGKYCLIHAHLPLPTIRIPVLGGVSELTNLTWSEFTIMQCPARNTTLFSSENQTPEIDQQPTNILFKKYCAMENSTNPGVRTITFRLGLCLPKTCTLDAVLRPYVEHPLIRFNYSEEICRLHGDKPYLGADYTGLVILTLIGLLTLACTAYELRYVFVFEKAGVKASELLRAFSLYNSTSRLFSFDKTTRSLDCLNGIRALSILWIIILHTQCSLIFTSINKTEMRQEINVNRYMLWVSIGELAVDSFFVLSGLLLVYTFLYKNKKLTWSSIPQFYWNRYTRLFPLLAMTVLLQASVMHRVVDGPRAQYDRTACLTHSWYLSVDMQLYLVSPLVLCWVLRSPRAAWTALAAAVASSLAGTLAFCFYFNFNKPIFGVGIEDLVYDVWYYRNTVTRSPPFFIGMLFGYILHIYRKKDLGLSKWSIIFCYSIAIALSSLAIFGHLGYSTQVAINIHIALYRSWWALALCWLVLACAHGYGGPVNWFLSLKLWQFVARISYAMYLFSFMIQTALFGSGAQYYLNTQTLLSLFATDLMYTLALSMAAYALVEIPVANLLKLLQNRIHKIHAPNQTVQTYRLKQIVCDGDTTEGNDEGPGYQNTKAVTKINRKTQIKQIVVE